MVYRLYSDDGGLTWTANTNQHFIWYEQYGDRYTSTTPRETYISGYLPRFQKRQMIGYYSTSGDLRSVEVNASGRVLVHVVSGLHVVADIAESGMGVQVQSGARVIVHSGIYIASGIAHRSGVGVLVQSGVWVASGIGVKVQSGIYIASGIAFKSGVGVVVQSGVYIASGIAFKSGIGVKVQSGLEIIWRGVRISGAVQASGILGVSGMVSVLSGKIYIMSGFVDIVSPTSVIINNSGNPLVLSTNSGGVCLWSGAIKSLVVKAHNLNSGDVYIGGYVAGQRPYSGCGMMLAAGEAININISQLGYIKAMAAISGDRVCYIGNN